MTLLGTVLTIVVLIGMAIFILLFERQRATRIQRDLHSMREQRREERRPPPTD